MLQKTNGVRKQRIQNSDTAPPQMCLDHQAHLYHDFIEPIIHIPKQFFGRIKGKNPFILCNRKMYMYQTLVFS